ncbi:hypothetical protein BVRB_4g088040 [Beta vulgaris subsp. vulgaris]|nr:hypothetical protein BVRB_4g088040 [Beta vulgaris subsp. vulgaris]
MSSSFFNHLQESVTPNPLIVDLGDDSDPPTTAMAREDNTKVVYQRRTGASASKAPVVEESSRSGREEENDVGPGTGALWLPEDATNGIDYLDLDVLGVDEDYRPLTHLHAAPTHDYQTMHIVTNGRRGGNRHGPQNMRRGRGASTSTRVPVVAATSNAPTSPVVPLRSFATQTVNRGALSRRRSREQTLDDSAANKRQAVEDPGTSAANEVVQIEDLDPNASKGVQGEDVTNVVLGNTGGTSLLSRSTSSIREKLRELIATPSFLSNLSPSIFYRFREWIEKKEVPLSDAVAAAFALQVVTPGKIYQPNWDVREDESMYSDIPENGGILAYRILKAAEARGAAKAVADFKASDDYVAELHKRYDGGWAAAMRCVCKTVPDFDWSAIEDAYAAGQHLSPFEGGPSFADEDAIADVVGSGGPARPLEARVQHHSRRWPATEKERENSGVKGLRRRENSGLSVYRGRIGGWWWWWWQSVRRWVVVMVVVVGTWQEVGGDDLRKKKERRL